MEQAITCEVRNTGITYRIVGDYEDALYRGLSVN